MTRGKLRRSPLRPPPTATTSDVAVRSCARSLCTPTPPCCRTQFGRHPVVACRPSAVSIAERPTGKGTHLRTTFCCCLDGFPQDPPEKMPGEGGLTGDTLGAGEPIGCAECRSRPNNSPPSATRSAGSASSRTGCISTHGQSGMSRARPGLCEARAAFPAGADGQP